MSGTLVFVDLEGTGLMEPRRITQIALVACSVADFNSGDPLQTREFCQMVNPTVPQQQSAKDITGFTDEQLAKYPVFPEVFPQIRQFLTSLAAPVFLVAHGGARFDFPVLRDEVRRTGTLLGIQVVLVDTFPIFKQYGQSRGGGRAGWTYGLRALHKKFFGREPAGRHDALGDTQMLLQCCRQIPAIFLHDVGLKSRKTMYIEQW